MHWFRLRGAFLVLVAASFWPLHILTVNLFGIVRPERIFGIIALIWVAGMLLIGLLTAFGIDVEPAENTSFVVVLAIMSGGPILREFGDPAYVILIVCSVIAGWLFVKLRGHLVVMALIWGTAVALAIGPTITFLESWGARGGPSAVADQGQMSVEFSSKPDIYLVVLDGYPGAIGAEQDQLKPGVVDVAFELRERGFHVPGSSWSSYWITELSIPSLLEMNYPVVDDSWRGKETSEDLQRIFSNGGVFTDVLNTNGYETYMVETGWSAASCGATVDHCVPSPLLDEATYLILKHTLAWALIDESPGPYVLGTLAGFDWLLENAPRLSESNSADFVFMHVISPHPPLLLTDDCSVDLRYERMGTVFNSQAVPTDVREGYLIEQMDCLDRMMLSLADSVDPDDVVIFVSDHGTDRREQHDAELTEWDRAAIVERLNNFLALRLPQGCEVEESIAVPNVLRAVIDCLSPATVEKVPERMWINPMVELEREVVDELMSMQASSG